MKKPTTQMQTMHIATTVAAKSPLTQLLVANVCVRMIVRLINQRANHVEKFRPRSPVHILDNGLETKQKGFRAICGAPRALSGIWDFLFAWGLPFMVSLTSEC